MALLEYFKRRAKTESSAPVFLPDENGPLSKEVPSSSIREANVEVSKALQARGKRKPYLRVPDDKKAIIAKYAAENGIVKALVHFAPEFPTNALKESTVRGWKTCYLEELAKKKDNGEELLVKTLPTAKMGRPLNLGADLDRQVQSYLLDTRKGGGAVTTDVAIAGALGIIRRKDSNLLAQNGGHIELTRDWARSLLDRMGFVKRKATTKAKVSVEGIDKLKEQFLFDIETFTTLEDIPESLIFNWDQTAIKYVPVPDWTMEKKGTKRVKLAGLDDKRQITAVFAATMTGEFLPPQLVYKGTTRACLPAYKFPDLWHITFTSNHWCNEETVKLYIEKVIVPYIERKKHELKLPSSQRALCIIDGFKAHCTSDVIKLLDHHGIDIVYVPANCTGELQPLDLSVNKSVKDIIKQSFQDWYADQIVDQKDTTGSAVMPITAFPLKEMKSLGAKWMEKAVDYMIANPTIIINGFRAAGIVGILANQ